MSSNQTLLTMQKYRLSKIYYWVNYAAIVIAVLQLIGEATGNSFLRLLKPLPIILIILYLTQSIIKNRSKANKQEMSMLVIFALLFSLVGDILLMFSGIQMFMIGTGFFLIAHIFYIVSFRRSKNNRDMTSFVKNLINGITITLIVSYIGIIYVLWDKFPDRVLFPIYGSIICILAIFSIRRYHRTNHASYLCILTGAFCFTLSDTILGSLKFSKIETDLGRTVVMILYYSAQFCLMHGAISHDNIDYRLKVFDRQNTKESILTQNKTN